MHSWHLGKALLQLTIEIQFGVNMWRLKMEVSPQSLLMQWWQAHVDYPVHKAPESMGGGHKGSTTQKYSSDVYVTQLVSVKIWMAKVKHYASRELGHI